MNEKSPHYCKESVWDDRFHSQCSRRPWKDGYCKQHHPDSVKKRKEKSDRKYKIENRLWVIRSKLHSLDGQCVALVKGLAKKKANKKAVRIVVEMNKAKKEAAEQRKKLDAL